MSTPLQGVPHLLAFAQDTGRGGSPVGRLHLLHLALLRMLVQSTENGLDYTAKRPT